MLNLASDELYSLYVLYIEKDYAREAEANNNYNYDCQQFRKITIVIE